MPLLQPAIEAETTSDLRRTIATLRRDNDLLRHERDDYRLRAHSAEAALSKMGGTEEGRERLRQACARPWWVRLVIRFGGAK